jgi:hypothetical protein
MVQSRASSFRCEYSLPSLKSSSSFLRLLPRHPVTSISLFIFPSITCRRRQFLRNLWQIGLAFRLLISCRIILCSLTISNTCSFLTCSVLLIFSILLQHHVSKLSRNSDLLPEASKFQHRIELHTKCSVLLVLYIYTRARARTHTHTHTTLVYLHTNFTHFLYSPLQICALYKFKIEGGMERGGYDCGWRGSELNEAHNKWYSSVLWTLPLSSLWTTT